MGKWGFLSVFFLFSFTGIAQPVEIPLYFPIHEQTIQAVAQNHDSTHVSYGPLYSNQLKNPTSILGFSPDSSKRKTWFGRKFFDENLVVLDKPDIYFTLDLVFNFTGGYNASGEVDDFLYQNTRGILFKGYFGKKVSFYTSFIENQARFPGYITKYVNNQQVVPGSGRVKNIDNNGFDYSMASAGIVCDATRFMRVKLGTDKDFLGMGYRSITLSDNSFIYPHVKIDFWFAKRKLKYTLNYALLQDLVRLPKGETPESLFERKAAVFHYLSYKPFDNFEFGVFNGVIMPIDPQGESASFYFNYFMPIIFWNSGTSNDYVQRSGLNLSWFITEKLSFYGQFMVDIKSFDSQSFLAGIRLSDLFTPKLNFTFEYSTVNSQNLTSDTIATYSHYNQSLAHPLGSGFDEFLIAGNYTFKRLSIMARYTYANRNLQDAVYWGFLDETDIDNPGLAQTKTWSQVFTAELQYLFNPKNGMNIALGYTGRKSGLNNVFDQTNYIYLSFRTSLRNIYLDF